MASSEATPANQRLTVSSDPVFSSIVDVQEAQRVERLADALSDNAPPWAAQYLKKAAPAFGIICAGAEVVGPAMWRFYKKLYDLYCQLPTDAASALWGMGICFFGGRYAVSLAAIAAFRESGGSKMILNLKELQLTMDQLMKANAEDDKVDEDKDGVADIDQIEKRQLAARKMALVLRTVDPGRVSEALSGLWSGYMGILCTLKYEFAKTVALAHSLGDNIRPLVAKILNPTLLSVTPPDYRKWISPTVNFSVKLVALVVAWKIQQVISSVHSGIQGGLLASRSLVSLLQGRKIINFGINDTMIDEIIGMGLAAGGIYYQLFSRGATPLILIPVLWPLGFLERWLQWSVTYMSVKDSPKVK